MDNKYKLAHDITQKVMEKIGDKFDDVHLHNPSDKDEGLDCFQPPEMEFNFFEEDEEMDCRDQLWIAPSNTNDDNILREIITIGREPSFDCWSMDWCLIEDGEFAKREFAYKGTEEKVLEHVLWLMKAGPMPEK